MDNFPGLRYALQTTSSSIFVTVESQPQALRAASVPSAVVPGAEPTATQLAAMLQAAVTRLVASGTVTSTAQRERLLNTEVRVADLDGDLLGLVYRNVITIDQNAAGWGWFIDSTPNDDDEFDVLAADVLTARKGSEAELRMDLLSVVLHELGHLLEDDHKPSEQHHVMHPSLKTGVRKRL